MKPRADRISERCVIWFALSRGGPP